jgi:flagellar basal-body rod protein FlgB
VIIHNQTTQVIEMALRSLALRQQVGANNIANVSTPFYTAGKVDFEDSLRRAIADGDVSRATATVSRSAAPPCLNGNNVDLAQELSGSTGLHYNLMLETMNHHYRILRSAMK